MKIQAVILMLLLAVSAFAADFNGKWKATAGPDGSMEITFNIKVEGGKVTGTSSTPMGEMQITSGSVDGDNITFTVSSDQFSVVHKGVVSGDEMKIKAEIGDQTMEMTAKRVK